MGTVEMEKARSRALTPSFELWLVQNRISRNGESPKQGIDTLEQVPAWRQFWNVEMEKARSRALTPVFYFLFSFFSPL